LIVFQEEEYSWFNQHQEEMRDSNLKGCAAINKNKQNHSEISTLTTQNPLDDSLALTSPKHIASTCSPLK